MGISETEALAFMLSGSFLIAKFCPEAGAAVTLTLAMAFFILGCFLLAFGIADVAVDHL